MTTCAWWADFLPDDLLSEVRQEALSRQAEFQASTVTTGEADYRRSDVLFHFEPVRSHFVGHLQRYLTAMHAELGDVVPLAPSEIEAQLTVTRHGGYFKRHTDNGCELTASRRLTFVYYFSLAEDGAKTFTGGELVLEPPGTHPRTILPNHNSIVIFPSGWMHEVRPVRADSDAFEHGRATINGWLRI